MNTLVQDLRYGLRVLAKNPGQTAVALLTLALAIGMNTAIFSLFDSILNVRLLIKDQKQIANLWATNSRTGVGRGSSSISDFLDYRQQNRVFQDLAAYSGQAFHLTKGAEPQQLSGSQVSFNYFQVLGVQPAMGRNFLPEESASGGARVALLSYGLWQRSFGADPAILGRNITLNRESYTIIGVMPAGFQLLTAGSADLWVPLDLSSNPRSRGVHQVAVIGALNPESVKSRRRPK